ncbi:MAG: hypothetical protein QXE22_06810 [Candidatus Bathyarchaeia archaeon]
MKKKIKISLAIFLIEIMDVTSRWVILNSQLRIPKEQFGIYLLDINELVVSDNDIVSYNKTFHEIKLNEEGLTRMKTLDLYHKTFVVKLDGKEIYRGAFWSGISSQSYSGIVMVDVVLIRNGMTDSIMIEKGYPSQDYFEGVDPRNSPEIFDYFEKVGKLI